MAVLLRMTFGKFSVLRQVIQDRGKNLELLTLAEYKYHSKKGDPVYTLFPPKHKYPSF